MDIMPLSVALAFRAKETKRRAAGQYRPLIRTLCGAARKRTGPVSECGWQINGFPANYRSPPRPDSMGRVEAAVSPWLQ